MSVLQMITSPSKKTELKENFANILYDNVKYQVYLKNYYSSITKKITQLKMCKICE